MPVMPRLDKKSTKVAYDILGTPPNLRKKKNKKETEINNRLLFEETSRVR